ncbi:hypothetical protein DPMN_125512 [Dreissena polymorpha]|uniref:Uncharacterized protein n=1 Tax=Dreissena polymorpha TaxID=45954 RepID=A0A9D4JX92_DREPO|nr:hypothetical protein DPMN_125512 [Dreissena polymorpha]
MTTGDYNITSVSIGLLMRLVCSVLPCVVVTFAFSLYLWLALSENEAECVSLHGQYKSYVVPSIGETRQLSTSRPQAELQGLGGGLPPDMRHARPNAVRKCLDAHEQTPSQTEKWPLCSLSYKVPCLLV